MEIKEAVTIIHQLIEQANSLGMFKKLQDLDIVRDAYKTITEKLNEVNEPG